MNFKSWLRGNICLVARLRDRGFEFTGFEDSTAEFQPRERSSIYPVVRLSALGRDTFMCVLLVMSEHVARVFNEQSLWLDAQPSETMLESGLLAVDLLWLRRNKEPENLDRHGNDYQIRARPGASGFSRIWMH